MLKSRMRGVFFAVVVAVLGAQPALAVMGAPDGVYLGRGTIFKAGGLIQVPFTVTRVLMNETMTSTSVANLLGLPVVFNSRLAFAPSQKVDRAYDVFSMDDIDANGSPVSVGGAGCANGTCSFSATIKRGRVSMRETWIVRPDGSFAVTQGWQNAYGVEMKYQAVFYRQ